MNDRFWRVRPFPQSRLSDNHGAEGKQLKFAKICFLASSLSNLKLHQKTAAIGLRTHSLAQPLASACIGLHLFCICPSHALSRLLSLQIHGCSWPACPPACLVSRLRLSMRLCREAAVTND